MADGANAPTRLRIGPEDIDMAAEIALLQGDHAACGAIASFLGLVRGADGVAAMTLEHYPGMTERQLTALVADCRRRWRLHAITIIHRIGRLRAGDRIVFVGVAAPHRGEAFAACEFLMDWLKTRAPFWKLEETASGERWVMARDEDAARAGRWHDMTE